jgi:hypothetical protein
VRFFEAIRPPQRTWFAELADDVLLGLAASGDLFEDGARNASILSSSRLSNSPSSLSP